MLNRAAKTLVETDEIVRALVFFRGSFQFRIRFNDETRWLDKITEKTDDFMTPSLSVLCNFVNGIGTIDLEICRMKRSPGYDNEKMSKSRCVHEKTKK